MRVHDAVNCGPRQKRVHLFCSVTSYLADHILIGDHGVRQRGAAWRCGHQTEFTGYEPKHGASRRNDDTICFGTEKEFKLKIG